MTIFYTFEQFKATGALVDPTLQDNIEQIFHVGNSHVLHSIIQCGLIPGGTCQEREVEYDLNNPRIAVCKNTWKLYQNTGILVVQKKGLQFYQTRSNGIVLYNTLPAICIEKVVYMKSGEELYNKAYQSPRLPRKAALKQNLHHGRMDLSNLEARTSVDYHSKESEEHGETRSEKVRGDLKR